jgi:heme-degrading monooxygenase HmoA
VDEPVTLIDFFEVPPASDEEFVTAWRSASDRLRAREVYLDAALHRSVAPDARFRFAGVARCPSPRALREGLEPGSSALAPYSSHTALYRQEREDSGPWEVPAAAVVIDPFRVAPEADGVFLSGWDAAGSALREQHGYLGAALYQSLSTAVDFRFVEITAWTGRDAYEDALGHPGFLARTNMRRSHIPFRSYPVLYTPVR